LQSQEFFVSQDIFPRASNLTSIRETFKRSTQGLAPAHILLYHVNVRGGKQSSHCTIARNLFKTLRREGTIPYFGHGSVKGLVTNSALLDITIVLFMSPTYQWN
jgi:hypothetical protein